MKRIDLIRHLERHGCEFLREGNNQPFTTIARSVSPHRFRVVAR